MKNGPSRSTQSERLFWLSAGRSSKRFRPRKRPLTAIVLFWYRSGRRTRLSSDTQPVSPVFSRGGPDWKDQKKKPPTAGTANSRPVEAGASLVETGALLGGTGRSPSGLAKAPIT